MLQKVLKTGLYVLLQGVLIVAPASAAFTSTDTVVSIEEFDLDASPTPLEQVFHYSNELIIEGEAENTEITDIMSVVDKTLSSLPDEHEAALRKLTLVFDDDAKRGQAGGTQIRLRATDMDEQEMTAVLVHEMGHIVDIALMRGSSDAETYTFMDGSLPVWDNDPSVEYYQISWASNEDEIAKDALSFVSGYARKDPFEDFAETYAYYVLHGDSFRVLALLNDDLEMKYEFMKEKVFDGVEFSGIGLHEELPFVRPYDATLLDFNLEEYWTRR